MTNSRLAAVGFTAAMLIAAAPALAGSTGAGVTARTLRIEELGPKYLLQKGTYWPPVHEFRRIATTPTDKKSEIEQLGPKYLLGR